MARSRVGLDALVQVEVAFIFILKPGGGNEASLIWYALRTRLEMPGKRPVYFVHPWPASACNFNPSALITLRTVSNPGLRSPESAL